MGIIKTWRGVVIVFVVAMVAFWVVSTYQSDIAEWWPL